MIILGLGDEKLSIGEQIHYAMWGAQNGKCPPLLNNRSDQPNIPIGV